MTALLELAGCTGYHATCLTPILWAIVFLAAVSALAGCLADRAERRSALRRGSRRPRRREGARHGHR